MDVVQPLHPAAGDHRQVGAPRQVQRRVDVAALQQPVAADVGEQQAGDARIFEPAGHVVHGHVGDFGPALGRDHAVLRIDRHHDAAFPCGRHVLHELRVLQRGGTDDHARHAEIEPALHRVGRADSAAKLDVAGKGRDDGFHRLAIAAFAGKRTVEVDDMQVPGPGVGKQHRLRRRLVAIDGGAAHVPFGQPHDFAVLEVDGGENDHQGFQSRKRERRSSP